MYLKQIQSFNIWSFLCLSSTRCMTSKKAGTGLGEKNKNKSTSWAIWMLGVIIKNLINMLLD